MIINNAPHLDQPVYHQQEGDPRVTSSKIDDTVQSLGVPTSFRTNKVV